MRIIFLLSFSAPFLLFAQSENAFVSKGNEYYLKLRFDEAEQQYRQAVQRYPRSTIARYNLANTLMQKKKYKEAIELYSEVAAAGTGNLKAAAYYNSGVGYSKQKDLPNSIEAYKSALRLNPNDKEARENLQKALSEQKQQQQQENENKSRGGGGGGMSQNEADRKLQQLRDKEKDLQRRLQNQGSGKSSGGGRDW